MKSDEYKAAYEAVEKVMLVLREENFRLKEKLKQYEPKPKESDFLDTVKNLIEG